MSKKPREKGKKKKSSSLAFHHAMIYTSQLGRSLEFYRDLLGFEVVDEYPDAYVRLKAPKGDATIALHVLEPGQEVQPQTEGIRLYFEIKKLDRFCQALADKGVEFDQMPQDMPWGWKHAYLRDPDGHAISLYWAGKARLTKTKIVDESQ